MLFPKIKFCSKCYWWQLLKNEAQLDNDSKSDKEKEEKENLQENDNFINNLANQQAKKYMETVEENCQLIIDYFTLKERKEDLQKKM